MSHGKHHPLLKMGEDGLLIYLALVIIATIVGVLSELFRSAPE